MNDYLTCIPWPGFGIGAACGFLLGVLVGRWDRHRSRRSTDMSETTAIRWRERYDRFAPWFVLFTLAVGALGIWIGVASIQTDSRQDTAAAAANKVRDEQNRALLSCFDDFADQLAGGLPPVRTATASRDIALATALGELRMVLVKATKGAEITKADVQELVDTFATYEDAADQLAQVRLENPYPDSPSEFCAPKVLED